MEIFKRALCLVCKKKKYIKFMICTPVENKNNTTSYCCNGGDCLRKLKLSIEKETNYHKNKIVELNKLLYDINQEEQSNIKQLRIN